MQQPSATSAQRTSALEVMKSRVRSARADDCDNLVRHIIRPMFEKLTLLQPNLQGGSALAM
ncbi:MAG: hypothetical protein ABJP79_12750 [Tateyamaria sp.]|uniref:hypothetical protein n=1 Tax=Tateyamaria sp. TaxID=1929288 RepID=UPI00329C897A